MIDSNDIPHLDELEAERARLTSEIAPGDPMLKWFAFKHLPPKLQGVSALFCELALTICALPRSAERTVALRKLLESKDAAVRAAL